MRDQMKANFNLNVALIPNRKETNLPRYKQAHKRTLS